MRISKGQVAAVAIGYAVNLVSDWTNGPIKNHVGDVGGSVWDARAYVFLIVLLVVWIALAQREKRSRPDAPTPPGISELPVSRPPAAPVLPFDPHRDLQFMVMQVDLANLWTLGAHSLDVLVYVKKLCPGTFTITDLHGSATIGEFAPTERAQVIDGPCKLTADDTWVAVKVRQPLSQYLGTNLGFALHHEDARLPLSMAAVKMVGTMPDSTPLPDHTICEEQVVISGPVRPDDKSKLLGRSYQMMVSPEWWGGGFGSPSPHLLEVRAKEQSSLSTEDPQQSEGQP